MHKKPSPAAMRAALAIINSGNPALSRSNIGARGVAEIIDRETSLPELLEAMNTLIDKSDGLISAIDGTTGQFEPEVAGLSTATSAAEKIINQIKEAKHGQAR
jgi:hypothetical protein